MNRNSYIKFIIGSAIVSVLMFLICGLIIPIKPYWDLLGYAILFFGALTGFIFWLSQRAVATQQSNFFLYIIFINIVAKLIASFIIIMIYVKANDPQDKYFLVPFLMTYLIFTISETYVLSEQARNTK